MRTPADLPRRRGDGMGSRGRVGLVVIAVALFLLLTSLRGIAGFWTDYLWFDSLGFTGVFTGVLGARFVLGALFTGIFFVVLFVNLYIADRIAPRFRPAGPEEEIVERYHELVGQRVGLVRAGVAALFAVIAGVGVASQWNSWILFTNAQEFGVDDPQFGVDIGFYVFQLPFLVFLVDWAFASLVIIAMVTAAAHYLNGGIRLQGSAQRVTPQVKAHISVILGLLALTRAIGYYLARFELNFSTRGTVDGATYTDVNAQLPALWLLTLISLAAFLLFIVNIWRRGWALPVLGVGLWAVVALGMGGIYPAFVQRFQVVPEESSREEPFIQRNIEATRRAYDLRGVETTAFAADNELTGADLEENEATIRNIRLWDPQVLIDSFTQLQEIRDYYRIPDVNVDRYVVDDEMNQVLISARELDTPGVPQDSWEAERLAYTHGYGAVVAPANAKTTQGAPDLLISDVPLNNETDIEVDQPGIYVGQGLQDYVIVGTDTPEIDYQTEDGETVTTEYDGDDGVGIGSYLRRAAFALRFGDINMLISGNLRDESRVLYVRDVEERVRSVAPFLRFDQDAYPAIVDGRIVYIVDGYTTSGYYPYAQRAQLTGLQSGSGLITGFNYVRNSVKAVVDAYDGTVSMYVIDDEDPIIEAYRSAFPDLFVDGEEASEDLRAHYRYPEDLFTVQTNMWGRYHIGEAANFYTGQDAWDVAPDPETVGAGGVTQQVVPQVDAEGRPISAREARIEPSYLLTKLPEEEDVEFLLLRPFVPVSGDDRQPRLTSFMVAKSDPGSYGELESFVMPPGNLPAGPGIVAAAMQSDPEVSEYRTLLGQTGTTVSFGNLVVYPVEQSLLYVRPLYVTPTSTEIPVLSRVVVYFDGEVQMEETLQEALVEIFGRAPETQEAGETEGVDPGDLGAGEGEVGEDEEPEEEPDAQPDPGDGGGVSADAVDLIEQANEAFADAQEAFEDGDLGEYQSKNDEGRRLLDRALEAARREGRASATTTTAAPDAGSA